MDSSQSKRGASGEVLIENNDMFGLDIFDELGKLFYGESVATDTNGIWPDILIFRIMRDSLIVIGNSPS